MHHREIGEDGRIRIDYIQPEYDPANPPRDPGVLLPLSDKRVLFKASLSWPPEMFVEFRRSLMLRKVYSVRDIKAGEYMGLVVFKNAEEAQRFFLMTITDQRGTMWKFPRDYAIHEVGTFDSETGVVNRREPVPGDVTPYGVVDSFVERYGNGASAFKQGEAGSGHSGGGVPAFGGEVVSGEPERKRVGRKDS